jgi:hypothetical protein
MVINALYKKYFQKSKIFVYPLLDIKRGTQVVPSETYFAWSDMYEPEDKKLICLYDTTEENFAEFEKETLLKHTRLCNYSKVNDKQAIFVFDFSDLGVDWNHMIYGRYSKINIEIKRKIVNFFDKHSGNYVYVTSYMFPEKFFNRYAELLKVSSKLLEEVGELCDKPDLEKEKLLIEVANFENISDSRLSL